ncbi:MAG: helix-turn-helix domain-containing protein [Acidimicrobiia bacterium]|nr:helix-turn-helix domain-containing protein [Acidimicrobiia bacterium]
MPAKKSLDHLDCVVAGTIDLVGDRWTLLIMRDVFFGVRRFDDFQNDLQISRNILSDRLQRLVENGILRTVPYQDNPPRHEYRLTDKGRDLLDVLLAVWRFGDKWEHSDTERVLIHEDCGAATHMVPACAECGGELTRHNLRVEPQLDVVIARRAAEAVR